MFEEQRQRRNPCLLRRCPFLRCGFHVYFALEKIPPLLCDYSHRAVRLTVIYIANRILNWGQVEAYLLPHNSDLSVGGFKTAEHQSETAGSGSAPLGLGHINLAEDKESEEVVTARSWILPPLRPLPDSVTESFFSFVLYCHRDFGCGPSRVRWWLGWHSSPHPPRCSGRAATSKRRPLLLSIINIKKKVVAQIQSALIVNRRK